MAGKCIGLHGGVEFSEHLAEARRGEMSVQAAGIGENPDLGLADAVILRADLRGGTIESDAVGSDAEECYKARFVQEDLFLQAFCSAAEFFRGEFAGENGGTHDEVADAVAESEEFVVFEG